MIIISITNYTETNVFVFGNHYTAIEQPTFKVRIILLLLYVQTENIIVSTYYYVQHKVAHVYEHNNRKFARVMHVIRVILLYTTTLCIYKYVSLNLVSTGGQGELFTRNIIYCVL